MLVVKNSIANSIGQVYTLMIGIIVTPLYLQYLGAEAYGLVGFFALMLAWMVLLDAGLSPALGRQLAYARGQTKNLDNFVKLLRSIEIIFVLIAVFVSITILLSSEWIANYWIKAENLELDTISYCISVMGLIIGLRFFSSLYRSGLNGLEDQVWLNKANIFLVSLKFIGALFLLHYISTNIVHFFEYQLFIGLLELFIIAIRFYCVLPVNKLNLKLQFHWNEVRAIAPFALGVAYSAVIWVLISQTDKLILSGLLSLKEFGYLSLVSLITISITALNAPIIQAVQPRMTLLLSQGKTDEMILLYRRSTQIIAWLALSVALTVSFFSEPLLYSWTGDREAAKWGADILFWFALGNGVLAVTALQYMLQSVFGRLKLHNIGNTISVIIQVPVIYYAAVTYGALGAGIAWFVFRLVWFFFWTPIVHKIFLPGLHFSWLFKDVLPIAATILMISLLLNQLVEIDMELNRAIMFLLLILLGSVQLIVSLPSSSFIREVVLKKIRVKVQ